MHLISFLGQKTPSTSNEKSIKRRTDTLSSMSKALTNKIKKRRRHSSNDSISPPPTMAPMATATAPSVSMVSTPHLSLFGGAMGGTSFAAASSSSRVGGGSLLSRAIAASNEEWISLSDYEDLMEMEREELGSMSCVQEVVEEYHQWHVQQQKQQQQRHYQKLPTMLSLSQPLFPTHHAGVYLLQCVMPWEC